MQTRSSAVLLVAVLAVVSASALARPQTGLWQQHSFAAEPEAAQQLVLDAHGTYHVQQASFVLLKLVQTCGSERQT